MNSGIAPPKAGDTRISIPEPDTEPGGGPAGANPLPGRGTHDPQLDAQPTDIEDPANNRYFSGTGRDDDPPPLPEAPDQG